MKLILSKQRLFKIGVVIFLIAMISFFIFRTYQFFIICYTMRFHKDYYIVNRVIDYRGDFDEERDKEDYYIYGRVLSSNEERMTMYKVFDSYADIGIPRSGDTIPIWYSEKLSKDIFILRASNNFPKEHFTSNLIKGGILITVLLTCLFLVLFNIVKL